MDKNEINLALEHLIDVFTELGISYYICGSLASSAYGISRMTQDVDLVSDISKNIVERFVEILKKNYFVDSVMIKEAIENKTSFNLIHLETMIKIDVFILKDDFYHKTSFERKIKDTLDQESRSLKIFLSSPEDIILSKLEWYRMGEEVSERQWLDVLGVMKVQKENLDKNYLKHWSKELKVYDLLTKAFKDCDLSI